ncbi:MAG: hypothetical protein CMI57_00585, partial [Parcubacteria group bacterium]|nr:hypothetical protein [Parcubacteria group bacterium]
MITKRQKEILDYIKVSDKKNDYTPSLKEIKKHFKLKAESTIHQHLDALIEKGYLEKEKNQPRGIRVPQDPLKSGEKINIEDFSTNTQVKKIKKLPINKIILGDVIQEIKKLPNESCDVVIIDPPYNIGKDFGNNLDKMELNNYISWCREWINESIRVLKPHGTIFI